MAKKSGDGPRGRAQGEPARAEPRARPIGWRCASGRRTGSAGRGGSEWRSSSAIAVGRARCARFGRRARLCRHRCRPGGRTGKRIVHVHGVTQMCTSPPHATSTAKPNAKKCRKGTKRVKGVCKRTRRPAASASAGRRSPAEPRAPRTTEGGFRVAPPYFDHTENNDGNTCTERSLHSPRWRPSWPWSARGRGRPADRS